MIRRMMKLLVPAVFTVFLAVSCGNPLINGEFSDDLMDPMTNFEALWSDLDERYAYFEEKGIDWDEKKGEYLAILNTEIENAAPKTLSSTVLFDILASMLRELEDGHVNLYSPLHTSYYDIREYEESDYDPQRMRRSYLDLDSSKLLIGEDAAPLKINGTDYSIKPKRPYYGGNTPYQVFSVEQVSCSEKRTILYMTYSSFMTSLGTIDSVLQYIHSEYPHLDGYVIDLRGNGGGSLFNAFRLMGRIVRDETYVYNQISKSVTEESFKASEPINAYPITDERSLVYQKNAEMFKEGAPIKFLTDRGSYSATNFFATMVRSVHYASENKDSYEAVDIELVGDYTGGGSGLPVYNQLPNGWTYRFSYDKICIPAEYVEDVEIDNNMVAETMFQGSGNNKVFHTEDGVPPHRLIKQDPDDTAEYRDTVFEYALHLFF